LVPPFVLYLYSDKSARGVTDGARDAQPCQPDVAAFLGELRARNLVEIVA
jgi:hypothetical protein